MKLSLKPQTRVPHLRDGIIVAKVGEAPQNSPQARNRVPPISLLRCGLVAAALSIAAISPAQTALQKEFLNPPPSARPMVRWWWFGAAVTKPEIKNELEQMKHDGIGGAELAFVYPEVLDDPAKGIKNLPFLSKEMLEAVTYAQAEGRRLGLRIDVTLCSGWPYGGPDTTLEDAATRLRVLPIPLPPGATTLPAVKLTEGDSILATAIAPGDFKHWNPITAKVLPPNTPIPADPAPRVAVLFIQSHTRQAVKRAAVGAEGYVLDPFSKQAVATHLAKVGEPLVKAFGATPPYAIFSDSLEAYGADWTPRLPEEFKKRRGYDLIPHLPELAAGGTPEAEKVRHDYGRTLTELVDENYLTQINSWAKAHHTKFRSQTYGEPAVSLASQRLVDLPEGEGPQWRAFSTLRWATSANHLFGNNVTSGETFTWLHSPVFRATPLDMKAEADIDFIMGENQLIFHGWPYSPPASELPKGDPGWSLYAAAVFNDHNPWHPVMPAVTQYITRVSALLRQGQPANQVAILLPEDDAWAQFAPGKATITGIMTKLLPPDLIPTILSAGYNFDFTDADTINRLGIHHQILVIPPTDRMPEETWKKIEAFGRAGGKVLSIGATATLTPDGTPLETGLNPDDARGLHNFLNVRNPNGKSTPIAGKPGETTADLATTLHMLAMPDLNLRDADALTRNSVGFIRRKLPNADIYFIANTGNSSILLKEPRFATSFSEAEIWNPETGETSKIFTGCALGDLAPYESRIIVFSGSKNATGYLESQPCAPAKPIRTTDTDLSADWKLAFTGTAQTVTELALTDWTANTSTRNYSGEVVYTKEFSLPKRTHDFGYLEVEGGHALPGNPTTNPEHPALLPNGLPDPKVTRPGPGMHAFYEGPIREAALVVINGQPAGALWHPPYRLDVSQFLKPGANKIEIHVYNTAINAWAGIPPHDYKPLIEKYGDRFQMQDLQKVTPAPSGILGKIHLVTAD